MRLIWLGFIATPLWLVVLLGALQSSGSVPVPTIPFLFVSLLGPQTGGFPALSETFYVGKNGYLQISEESSDGVLNRLRHGLTNTEPFFERKDSFWTSDTEQPMVAKTEVTDYFPPRVVLIYATASDEYLIRSYEQAKLPESVAALVTQVALLRDRSELADAAPGIYVRAQRIQRFDPRIQTPDLVIDMEEAMQEVNFSNLIRREMALMRMGSVDENVLFFGRVALRPEDPVHIQLGRTVYRILVYQTQSETR